MLKQAVLNYAAQFAVIVSVSAAEPLPAAL